MEYVQDGYQTLCIFRFKPDTTSFGSDYPAAQNRHSRHKRTNKTPMAKIEKFCRTYPNSTQNTAPCSIADSIERYGRMLTVKELAHLLAESPKTTYARVKRGSQPATLVGGAIRFDPYETAQWLRSQSA